MVACMAVLRNNNIRPLANGLVYQPATVCPFKFPAVVAELEHLVALQASQTEFAADEHDANDALNLYRQLAALVGQHANERAPIEIAKWFRFRHAKNEQSARVEVAEPAHAAHVFHCERDSRVDRQFLCFFGRHVSLSSGHFGIGITSPSQWSGCVWSVPSSI